MTRTTSLLIPAFIGLIGLVVTGCHSSAEADASAAPGSFGRLADEGEVEIPLSAVPENVKQAALDAVDGLALEEASRETEDGVVIYDLEGEANGVEYEIEVTAAGDVTEIEVDDDEDDDDHDGDDHDDHDDDGDHDDHGDGDHD